MPKGEGYPGEKKAHESAKEKEHRKDKMSGIAKETLKQRGGQMNEAEKAFVGHFVKRDEVSSQKAKKILKEGEIEGKPLTKKQEGFFGARAGEG